MEQNKIVILGWGSLIWDSVPLFDKQIYPWLKTGPVLPIEFCRISKSRKNALTLVIDEKLGTEVTTLYSISRRSDFTDAICDLRSREGTLLSKIGFVNLLTDEKKSRNSNVAEAIKKWAKQEEISYVVWTDLDSNFKEKSSRRNEFTYDEALLHLKGLDFDGFREAINYIFKAPGQITTGFRKALEKDAWFKDQVEIFKHVGNIK